MIIIFVEFIDQLIDYPINCASLKFSTTATNNNSSSVPGVVLDHVITKDANCIY